MLDLFEWIFSSVVNQHLSIDFLGLDHFHQWHFCAFCFCLPIFNCSSISNESIKKRIYTPEKKTHFYKINLINNHLQWTRIFSSISEYQNLTRYQHTKLLSHKIFLYGDEWFIKLINKMLWKSSLWKWGKQDIVRNVNFDGLSEYSVPLEKVAYFHENSIKIFFSLGIDRCMI